MTLVVGCQPTGVKWTDAVNNDKVIINGETTLKAYTFNPPIINNTYCKIGFYSVVNVINRNLTHPTEGI